MREVEVSEHFWFANKDSIAEAMEEQIIPSVPYATPFELAIAFGVVMVVVILFLVTVSARS